MGNSNLIPTNLRETEREMLGGMVSRLEFEGVAASAYAMVACNPVQHRWSFLVGFREPKTLNSRSNQIQDSLYPN